MTPEAMKNRVEDVEFNALKNAILIERLKQKLARKGKKQ